jgi:hypothetical protein
LDHGEDELVRLFVNQEKGPILGPDNGQRRGEQVVQEGDHIGGRGQPLDHVLERAERPDGGAQERHLILEVPVLIAQAGDLLLQIMDWVARLHPLPSTAGS